MLKYKFIPLLSSLLLFFGCKQEQKLENFTYRYSMESTGNFKVEFQLNPDTTYEIHQTNQYFDKFDGTCRPVNKKGKLTEEEYMKLRDLIQAGKIDFMRDSYGFDENIKENSIIYNLELEKEKHRKFVTINMKTRHKFSDSFLQLIEHTNSLINNKIASG